MTNLSLLSIYLLGLGVTVLTIRSNYIFILLALELLSLGVNLLYIDNGIMSGNAHQGLIIPIYLLTLAGMESAIGLALLIAIHKKRGNISLVGLNSLKG
jgi:NADH:ubiquinone oxidoreductase subunit K